MPTTTNRSSLPKVPEVLARKRPLNLAMISKLHRG